MFFGRSSAPDIAEATTQPRQGVVGNARVSGIVDFDHVGQYWLVKREYFEIGANALLVHLNMMMTVDGADFRTPDQLTGVVFPTVQQTGAPRR